MVVAYIRFSTSKQEDTQQMFALEEYAKSKGITIDVVERDEGVSGGVSYKDRNLYGVIKKMGPGDTLIATEISRLGRSMADLNKLVNDELMPRKIRLIVTKMCLDLNCASISAIDQMVLFAFGFSAQLEKEMIQQRTQSAIDARKEAIKAEGGFISKSGRWCTKLGRKKGADTRTAVIAAGEAVHGKAMDWRKHSELYDFVERCVMNGTPRSEILAEASRKYDRNPEVWGTREGKRLTKGTLSRWIKEMQCGI